MQGVTVGANGERWTMATAGSGNWPPQRSAIRINGEQSPSASSIRTLEGEPIATGSTFQVALPPYSMTWLRIPIDNVGMAPKGTVTRERLSVRQTAPGMLLVTVPVDAASESSWTLHLYDCAGRIVRQWSGEGLERSVSAGCRAKGVYLYVLRVNNETCSDVLVVK